MMRGGSDTTWYHKWLSQVRLLLWKNYRVALRNRKTTVLQFLSPVFFIIVLFAFQKAIESTTYFGDFYQTVRHQEQKSINSIPLCATGTEVDHCYTFIYAPTNNPEVEQVIKWIREQNNPPIPESSIMGFATASDVDDFLINNLNTTQGAFLFDFIEPNVNETLRTLSYTVQVNFTDNYSHGILLRHQERIEVPMVFAAERALMQLGTRNASSAVNWDVSLLEFPHDQVLAVNMIGQNGPLFIFAAMIVNFVIALGQIVAEKEFKLRESMKIMGLYDSAYWVSWFITMGFWMTSTVFILIIFGCIFQFSFFLKNDFGLYFLLLWLFSMTLVSLAFLASTLVKKASASTSLGFAMFFIGFFLQFGARVVFSAGADASVRNILSLLSPSMLQVGLTNLGAATEKQSYSGLSWEAVTKPELTAISVISFQEMYGWLILDFFIYLLLALYLDNVLKNEQGTRKPYWYFLTRSYWTGRRYVDAPDTSKKLTSDDEYQSLDEDVKEEEQTIFGNKLPENTAVVLRNLCKVYERSNGGMCSKKEEFRAVKDLSYYIEENTLFCFLGPNGAGKTTTIHMLVGFHEATYGDANICGYSIRDQMSSIQSIMGLCPQFDILWGELTGEEHLRLFAGLRNLSKDQIESEVARLLNEVSLHSNAHVRTSAYSGGERRRLSVAIALIGDPKIVILDEPTTGMDPVSRREVWNVIEKAKKNRVVILTTHSMEEADVLGDKIGIVAKGRLQCVGSSLHLKQKFGAGYTITVGTAEDQVERVQEFFEKNLKGSKLTSPPLAGYLHFAVDRQSDKELVPFFKELEKNSTDLGIHDTQLSITTLEQVFLTVAENSEVEKMEEYVETPKDKIKEEEEEPHQQTLKDQFVALLIKSGKLQSREHKTNICQILTPFVFVSILIGFQALISGIVGKTPTEYDPHPSALPNYFMLTLPTGIEDPSIIFQNLAAVGGVKLYYSYAPGIDSSIIGNFASGSGILGKVSPPMGNSTPVMLQEFNPEGFVQYLKFQYIPYDFVSFSSKDDMENSIFDQHYDLPTIVGGYYFDTIDFANNNFRWSVSFNGTLTHQDDVPALMNRMSNAISQSLPAPFKLQLNGIKPMPTQASDGIDVDIVAEGGNIAYILILHQLLPVFMTNVVAEKESKIRELMRMTGLQMSLYWIVHYMFNFAMYLIVSAMLIISGEIYSVRFFTLNDFGTYYLLFLLWGNVLIAFAFLMSVFFNSRKAASVVGYVLVIAIGLFTYVLLDNLLGDFDNTPQSVRLGVSVIPPCALYKGLMYLTAQVRNQGPGYRFADVNNEVVNLSSVYVALSIEWVVLMVIWWYLEQIIPSQFGLCKHPLFFLGFKYKTPTPSQDTKNLPEDVKREREEVNNMSNDLSLRVMDINKVYPAADGNPPNHAVKNVSFGVKHAMCHGLLGHNGAGKTTLLNILIGLYTPNSGTADIYNNSIIENPENIHSMMGVCTQYDILWENLTGFEHLQFYGRLRNLKGKKLKVMAKTLLKKLNLYESRNVLSAKYSGGMKRRLSVAIALLGYPKAIFLDEPSTGLDPKSRERMWRLINEAKQQSTILLTTHSMEEADAICDRLMIMSHGEVSCIGVSSDLKNRFGEGFKLSVQVAKGYDQKPTEDFIQKRIPKAVLLNSLAGTKNYQIPKGIVTLDQVFEWMETNKEELHITDWAITHTTLEEVFLRLQNDEKPVEKAEVRVEILSEDEVEMKEVSASSSSSSSSSTSEDA